MVLRGAVLYGRGDRVVMAEKMARERGGICLPGRFRSHRRRIANRRVPRFLGERGGDGEDRAQGVWLER